MKVKRQRQTEIVFLVCSGIIREGDTLQKIDDAFVDHLDVGGVRGLLLGASGSADTQSCAHAAVDTPSYARTCTLRVRAR